MIEKYSFKMGKLKHVSSSKYLFIEELPAYGESIKDILLPCHLVWLGR